MPKNMRAGVPGRESQPPIGIVGGTIIDGHGGAPIVDGTVVITGNEITSVGKRSEIVLPENARTIHANGKYIVPGFIDTNIHLDLNFELFPLLVYGDEDSYAQHSLAAEGAQVALKHGITTLLDTYGPLFPLLKLRDRINSGEIVGPRLLVAGNIIGWDGPLSPSESKRKPSDLKPWEQTFNAWFTQGTGATLTQMYPDEVRDAVNRYMDLGPDLIKIGVTEHDVVSPINLCFSLPALRAIVEAAHSRGLRVQCHSGTVEGHRMAVEAGIDIITHAGSLYSQKLRLDFAKQLADSATHFALFSHGSLPPYEYLRGAVGAALAAPSGPSDEKVKIVDSVTPDRNRAQRLPKPLESPLPGSHNPLTAFRRDNQRTLIEAGCKIVVATDSHPPMYDDITSHSRMHPDMGFGTINAIEGLVIRLGMTPAQAIVAATKTSATAAGLIDQIGTIEKGKLADLLVLDANPLDDILNIRKLATIIHNGAIIASGALPSAPKFYKP